jgi:hypothetical protein
MRFLLLLRCSPQCYCPLSLQVLREGGAGASTEGLRVFSAVLLSSLSLSKCKEREGPAPVLKGSEIHEPTGVATITGSPALLLLKVGSHDEFFPYLLVLEGVTLTLNNL